MICDKKVPQKDESRALENDDDYLGQHFSVAVKRGNYWQEMTDNNGDEND